MPQLTDRFTEAVLALVADGSIKQRLLRAFAEHLGDLDEQDVPVALRREFGDLRSALNKITPVGSETRVRASVKKMSAADAAQHAETIVRLCAALLSQAERAEPLKVVTAPKKPPRYLANGS
jgi:hypothetical protein